MRKFTFFALLKSKSVSFLAMALVFSMSFAQNSYTIQFQDETIEMPENIDTFEWNQMPDSAQLGDDYVGWVQFYNTPDQTTQDFFRSNGLQLIDYIPHQTYLFRFPQSTSINVLKDHGVRSIVAVEGRFKLAQDLKNGNIGDWAIDGSNILVTLQYHEDVSSAYVVDRLASLQILVAEQYNNSRNIDLSIPDNCLDSLTDMPFVKWVELVVPPSIPDDVRGRSLHRTAGLDTQTPTGWNYDGEGVGILVRDQGPIFPHKDFEGRLTNIPPFNSGTHGIQVAGAMTGAGNINPDARGMAAGADLNATGYSANFLDTATVTNINNGTVQVTNSSYSNGCNAGYTTIARTVDTQTHTLQTVQHVFSAGNSNGSNCGYGAGSQWGNITGGHKSAKNCITVGATEFDGDIAGFSSRGPAEDGRIKPDISGHGVAVQMTNPNNTYTSSNGTSFSAPAIAGVATQLYHLYMDNNGGMLPQSALIKAAMLNTATDFGNVGPDFIFGWGIVNGHRAGLLLEDDRYLSDDISQGNTNTHTINVPAGTAQVRFMVYWHDVPATAGASPALVNDLDLVVTDPGAGTHLPYLLDHSPNATALNTPAGNGADHLNNMEQVLINAPTAGDYDIDITGFNVPTGPQEYFVVYEIIEDNITVTYPNGGEKFRTGFSQVVHWDSVDTTQPFDLEYSDDNGGSWNAISTVPANRRNFTWNVPNTHGEGEMLLRVTSGAFSDESDDNFSIADLVTGLTIDEVCPTEITFSWNAVTGAESYDLYMLGAKYMEVVANSTTTTVTIPTTDPNAEFWYAMSAKNTTEGWEGRRTNAVRYAGGVLNCVVLEVEDLALDNISMYPNPAQDQVFVTLGDTNLDSFEIVVSNSLGQSISTVNGTNNEAVINVSSYTTGLYFVTIKAGSQSTTKKLVVK